MLIDTIKIGDYITFKAAVRDHCRVARRKVNGFRPIYDKPGPLGVKIGDLPTVRYWSCGNFVVRQDEIIQVHH